VRREETLAEKGAYNWPLKRCAVKVKCNAAAAETR